MAYQTYSATNGEKSTKATVYIPFNFTTEAHSSISNSPVVFGGASVDSYGTVSVGPRCNASGTDGKSTSCPNGSSLGRYTTYTPTRSRYQLIDFYIKAEEIGHNADGTSVFELKDSEEYDIATRQAIKNPCDYVKSRVRSEYGITMTDEECKVAYDSGEQTLNPGAALTKDYNMQATRTVPDKEVGNLYCVASAIYPAESHDYAGTSDATNKIAGGSEGLDRAGGTLWHVSAASCRTIAKQPNFQVWGGGLYTEGNVDTSVTKKIVNAKLDEDGKKFNINNASTFGSWDEQLVIANGSIEGFSSASGLGYFNAGAYNFKLQGGAAGNATQKDVSKLTVTNLNSNTGGSGITGAVSTTISRLNARYKEAVPKSSSSEITTTESGLQYLYHSGSNLSISAINPKNSALRSTTTIGDTEVQLTTVKGSSGQLIKSLTTGKYTEQDNTLIIVVNGSLIIDENICYANSAAACDSNSSMLYNYSDISTNNIAALPQILIFASDGIAIEPDVTRIDAWLITDGELDTCNGTDTPNADQCNKQLVINGPVIVKGVVDFDRTHGAFPGAGTQEGGETGDTLYQNLQNDGSITPAEIFNLRSDVYLWAYAQVQRYTQATVTYIRELAPRY